ncbi:MAG: Fic family protein [Thermoflexaceae bacterium]|nr:Fic family protein [Thermoflexaceae bacterium]
MLNYVEALDHGLRHVSAEGITADLVRTLHRMLMQRGRGEAFATPGDSAPSRTGGRGLPSQARYVPPPPAAALDGMDALFAYLANPAPTTQVLVEAAWIHYQFEALHPFLDGNGRVGRLLVPLLLAWRRKLSHPLLYVSPFFEHHRTEYYDRLFDVSARGDWSGWLGFFLEAVRSQAAHGVALATRIIALGKTWHDRLDAVRAPECPPPRRSVHQFIALDAGTRMLGVAGQTATPRFVPSLAWHPRGSVPNVRRPGLPCSRTRTPHGIPVVPHW